MDGTPPVDNQTDDQGDSSRQPSNRQQSRVKMQYPFLPFLYLYPSPSHQAKKLPIVFGDKLC